MVACLIWAYVYERRVSASMKSSANVLVVLLDWIEILFYFILEDNAPVSSGYSLGDSKMRLQMSTLGISRSRLGGRIGMLEKWRKLVVEGR